MQFLDRITMAAAANANCVYTLNTMVEIRYIVICTMLLLMIMNAKCNEGWKKTAGLKDFVTRKRKWRANVSWTAIEKQWQLAAPYSLH